MSLRRERNCRNVLLLLPCGAGCLGNPSTGQLRAAELCLRLVGLLFFPCLYLCPQGLLEPVHPFEPRAPLAAQAEEFLVSWQGLGQTGAIQNT